MENLLRFNKDKTFTLIDFETESLCLYIPNNLPWEVAMLKIKGDDTLDTYVNYIKWDRPFKVSMDAAKITGFNAELVLSKGVDYKAVIDKVVGWIESTDYVIFHNGLNFDIYFIYYFYKLAGKSIRGLMDRCIDTNALMKGIKLGIPYVPPKQSLLEYQYQMMHTIAKGVKTNLKACGQGFNIEHDYETLHSALSDIILNKKVFDKIKLQVDI